jgi:Transposase
MGMWRPYKEAVNAVLPQATIVVDKFHVLRLANAALEAIRKEHRTRLTRTQRRRLMHDRFLLLKRRRDLTPQEQLGLASWALWFPVLAPAYEAKEDFCGQGRLRSLDSPASTRPRTGFPRADHRDEQLGYRDPRVRRSPDHQRLHRVAQLPDPPEQPHRAGLLAHCDPGQAPVRRDRAQAPQGGTPALLDEGRC